MENIKEFIAGNYFTIGGICKNINSNKGFEFAPKEIFSKITYGLQLPSWETSDSTLKRAEH